jgi:uncharacterized cupredoxin-like copper-binding protein
MLTRPIATAVLATSLFTAAAALAEGDLTRLPTELPALVLGSEQSDYAMSENRYELETGKAYKLEIVSTGRKEYAIRAPEFFANIFLRKVEAGDMEIKAVSLTELEFEQEGEAELYFVPVKPGEYRFYSAGLEGKGMVGTFSVR